MFPFRFLAFVAACVGFAEDRRERFGEGWAELFVIGDVEPGVEGLVREPPVGVAGVLVGVMCISQQPERVMEERPPARVVLAVLGKAAVHVGETRADAALVPLQRVDVDGIGEVRREQLVGLCFQARPVRR